MRRPRQVTLTLLATAAMTSMPCFAEWSKASAKRQMVTADAFAGFVERGGFGRFFEEWWPLLVFGLWFMLPRSGGE